MWYFTMKAEAIWKFAKQYMFGIARLLTFSTTTLMQQERSFGLEDVIPFIK